MTERALLVGVDGPTSHILRGLLAEAGLELLEAHAAFPDSGRYSSCAIAFVGIDAAGRVPDLVGRPLSLPTVVLVAERQDLGVAAAALRAGAHDCLLAPVEELELVRAAIRRALERERWLARCRTLESELAAYREQIDGFGCELADLANRDALTGVYNRRYLRDAVEHELGRARRHGHPFSLIALELEGLADYDEAHGHLASDELLRAVARLLETRSRASSTLSRFGGGEFVMLVPEVAADGAASFAVVLRDTLAERVLPGPAQLRLNVGIAGYPEAGDESAALIEHVEHALARARREGPNRVALWTPFAGLAS